MASDTHPGSTVPVVVVAVGGLGLGYAAWRGAALTIAVVAIIAVGAAYLAFQTWRHELAAGPGWLSSRDLVRRHWVRTDQLVRVQDQPSGVDRVLTLHDRDGRSVGVLVADLRRAEAVRARLLADLQTSVASGLKIGSGTRERIGLP